MKILVSGGAGFIGSNFIRHMLVKYPNYEIINLDKLTYAGNLNNLKDLEKNKKYSLLKGDICDKKIVEKLIKRVNIIINFAAESHVDRSIIKSDAFIQTNVFGTYVLLQAAKEFKIKKFIHISTDEVYGSIDSGSFNEDSSLKPSSPYSASKASSDMLVTAFNVTYGLSTIITRSTNNFGPFQYPEKLIPLFITNLLEGKKIPLYGDGLNVRDWFYVIDNCEAIDFLLHHGKEGEIYNIGASNEKTNLEITKKILNFLGKDGNFIEYVNDRLGHDRRYSLDCSKIKTLGWKPKFEFDDALETTINWYKNNEWWWKPLKKRMNYGF